MTNGLAAGGMGVLGLLIGSFLNVVVARLPRMLEARWQSECAAALGSGAGATPAPASSFNLCFPPSSCPQCGRRIGWFENIPLLSYVLLRGRCSGCHSAIAWRYPAVELASGLLFFYCGARWGLGATAWVWAGFCATLLALALIDWDTTLLPDDLTVPLLWAGLISAALQWSGTPLLAALWGAVVAYLFLWGIFWLFKLLTGKTGMGHGDFKLFAALGAWLGWQALLAMLLIASVLGAAFGIYRQRQRKLAAGGYLPFGPFLAFAGLMAMVLGPATLSRWTGL